jgi:hypothetical protein
MNILGALILSLTTTTLVLHSGDRIAVDGSVTERNGMITFRSEGTLYTMPASEVARIDRGMPAVREPIVVRANEPGGRVPLRVSEERRRQLIEELEKNHSGQPAPPFQRVPEPSPQEVKEQTREEWSWRQEARSYEETVRRAAEDLQMLHERAAALQQKIHSLVSQGYKANQFSYDSAQLVRTLERIPYAELELVRAERALDRFREDARRQGVLPGWLR